MNLRRTIATAAAAAVLALSLVACSADGPEERAAGGLGGTLNLGYLNEPTSFDPAQAQEGHFMAYYQGVYDSLILRKPDGELAPMLATEWEYNDDKTELTLKLRDDVTFSDGAKFDADAVKANIEHFQTAGGPQASTLTSVTGVTVVDATTVTLELSAPDPALLICLSNAAGLMGSPEALGTDAIKTEPVGSGPYTLVRTETTIGSQYTYATNPDYWYPELQHYEKIVFKVLPDITARYNALLSGEVDATRLDATTGASAEGAGLTPYAQAVNWQGLMIFDRAGQIVPALADPKVRQAINLAIDKEGILSGLFDNRGTLTEQIFGKASSAFDAALDETYSYDPEEAKKLLAEAGYPDGFAFTSVTAAAAMDPTLVAVLKDNFAAVGITADFVEVPISDYLTEVTSGKYPIAWFALFQPSSWLTIQQALAPDALYNPLKYQDPTVDSLINDIQFAADEETEAAAAQELNAYIVDQAWFNPWFTPDLLWYANDKVKIELQVEQGSPSIYNYSPINE
jgi:peptide/nickel transport system substrate-binding protein